MSFAAEGRGAVMATRSTRAYWVEQAGRGALRPAVVPGRPAADHALVRALCSGVSPGTERLVGCGRVPGELHSAMACTGMEGSFELPVKYGYSLVGEVLEGSGAGQRVFAMHPHQELAHLQRDMLLPLPDRLPSERAVLIPNMETALNAVWDGEPWGGERVAVIGGGVVGLLTAYAWGRCGHGPPTLIETDPARRQLAAGLPWFASVLEPGAVRRESFDLLFHTSGQPAGLARSLELLAFEGTVIELSWYGDREVPLPLGRAFHHLRLRIVSSQVGAVAAARRQSTSLRQRLERVLELLDQPALDALLGEPVPFEDMPALMDRVYRGEPVAPVPCIHYPRSG